MDPVALQLTLHAASLHETAAVHVGAVGPLLHREEVAQTHDADGAVLLQLAGDLLEFAVLILIHEGQDLAVPAIGDVAHVTVGIDRAGAVIEQFQADAAPLLALPQAHDTVVFAALTAAAFVAAVAAPSAAGEQAQGKHQSQD